MADITLTASAGRRVGSSVARRLRVAGKVPGVLYGHGIDPVALSVDARELRHVLSSKAGANVLVSLELDGQSYLAIPKAVQRNALRQEIDHVDFQIVRRDERVSLEVPLVLTGEAEAVRLAGGAIEQSIFAVHVMAAVDAIPSSIPVDVSGLTVGDAIRVGDLPLPAGVEPEGDSDLTVLVAHGPAAEEEPAEADATAADAATDGSGEG